MTVLDYLGVAWQKLIINVSCTSTIGGVREVFSVIFMQKIWRGLSSTTSQQPSAKLAL